MSLNTCLDWFKKLRLFSYVLNLKIDAVPKASRAVVIRRFSLNEAPLGLFKFISDYLPYFEKINIFFNIIKTKFELIYRIDRNYLFGSFEIISFRLYTPLRNLLLPGVYNLIEVISSWTDKNCDQSLNN